MEIYLQKYRDLFNIDGKLWPNQVGYEAFRMKRYMPNNLDDFKFHVDVGDYASARRFLVFFWYLNDVAEGGETTFQQNRKSRIEMAVKPVAGRMITFPPLWTHPHTGMKPISGPKYIIGGYLHYIRNKNNDLVALPQPAGALAKGTAANPAPTACSNPHHRKFLGILGLEGWEKKNFFQKELFFYVRTLGLERSKWNVLERTYVRTRTRASKKE